VLALSMLDDENIIIKMIRNGAKGYVLKDCDPGELKTAIQSVLHKGFYHSELVSSKLIHALSKGDKDKENGSGGLQLSEKEREFLKWVCTDLSYKEIAGKMHVSPRTVDGYRDALHEKLEVKSRVGMVLFAIKNGIVSLT
jgi:DNA-binding NarL/FixJ family response regulator